MIPSIAPKTAGTIARNFAGSLGGGARQLVSTPGARAARRSEKKIDPDSPPHPRRPPNAQDFVKHQIEPGEWDFDRIDPTHHPKWRKNRARILSAEDFANRPRAGFNEEFAGPHDAMATLCWLTQEQREGIYKLYLDMMTKMASSDRGVTSHEYVMRVVAQKYNISPMRAAAIVQLEHNEDRIRREHPERKIHYEVQEYVDAKIREHIHKVYQMFDEQPPEGFVEDPIGVMGTGDPYRRVRKSVRAEDLYDVDALTKRALMREKEEAQLAIDGHVYIEDVDYTERDVKLDGNAKKLMEMARKSSVVASSVAEEEGEGEGEGGEEGAPAKTSARPDDQSPLPDNGRGISGIWAGREDPQNPGRRPRWKYAAKIIDTSKDAQKIKRNKKLKKYIDKGGANTLIEHGGVVRPATIDEATKVAWKPVRHEKEFTYKGVKQAWLDRTLRGNMDGWGRVERDLEKEKEMETLRSGGGEDDTETKEEGEEEDGAGESAEEAADESEKNKKQDPSSHSKS